MLLQLVQSLRVRHKCDQMTLILILYIAYNCQYFSHDIDNAYLNF